MKKPGLFRVYFAGVLALLLPLTAQSAIITVNSAGDLDVAGDGDCELREAINNANVNAADMTGGDCATGSATGVTDSIEFAITGTGEPYTIMVNTSLPLITDTMIIDAQTQLLPIGCTSTRHIVIDGMFVAVGTGFNIDFSASNVTIRGFSIVNFASTGVRVDGNNNNIECNYIGLGPTGSGIMGNGFGVVINGGSNTIGGATVSERNVIGNNAFDGIFISGIATTNNDVFNNYIGLEADGTTAATNGGNGVHLNQAQAGNNIGNLGTGNVISSNVSNGIAIDSASDANFITGNIIGLDSSGSLDRGNGASGVNVFSGDLNTIEANTISGNTGPGVSLTSLLSSVYGNFIGTNSTGTAAVPNSIGVYISDGGSDNIGGGGATERNIISGNTGDGVLVEDNANGVNILGNFIGVGANGTTAIPNGSDGVSVQFGAQSTVIGAGAANEGNVISGNAGSGVDIGTASGTVVIQNIIGLGADGTTLVPNGSHGVSTNFSGVAVGTDPSVPNIISGNNGFGVYIGPAGNNTEIVGNLIGTDISGTLDRGNAEGGVNIDGAAGVSIGPPGFGRKGADVTKGFSCPCNWISGNDGPGVLAGSNGFGVLFDTNVIGADINGNPTLPNQGAGVVLRGTSGDFINNLITGNIGWGIYAFDLAGFDINLTGNRIQSNTGPGIGIDTDVTIGPSSGFNCFSGNGAGIENSAAAVTADDNWWGAPDGPGGAGPGSGDTISANVTVNTFQMVEPAGCESNVLPVTDGLTLGVSDSVDPVAAGTSFSYTVTVTNILGETVSGIKVNNLTTLPTGVVIAGRTPSQGTLSGSQWSIPNLSAGGSATLVFNLSVSPSAVSGINVISHYAVITAVGGGLSDTDADTERTSIVRVADLAITKTSVPDAVLPGSSVVYTITTSNAGPGNVSTVQTMDDFPGELVDVTWTCTGSGGASCPATGVGDVDFKVPMPPGSTITIVAMARLPLDSDSSGVVNTAVVVVPIGVTDPDLTNNSAGTGTPVVEPLSLLPGTTVLPEATVGEAYEITFNASGGLAPLTVQGSDAPPGLEFAKVLGVTSARASVGAASARLVSLIGSHGESNQITTGRPHPGSGKGDTPVTLLLSGVPTAPGTFTVSVSVTDSATPAQIIERAYELPVAAQGDGSLLPLAVVGASYGAQLTNEGLPSPVTWSLSGGNLPPGLALNATGLVNGIPQVVGVYPFNATARGANQSTLASDFSITVFERALFSLTPSTLPNGLVGANYNVPVLVDGGTPPYVCSLGSGTLPPGLAIQGCANSIRGAPDLPGIFNFVVFATDNSNPPLNTNISLRVAVAADTLVPAGEPPDLEGGGDPEEVPESGQGSPGLGLPDESLQHVAVDAFGHQYFTGYAWNGTSYDIQIFKYDSQDRRVWQQSYDSGGQDYGYGIAINPQDQGIYVSGYLLSGSKFQAILIKYDVNGVLKWERRTSAGQLLDAWYDLATDTSGVYAAGERYNGLNFDALFSKYDHAGNLLWETTRDTFDTESAYAITLLDCGVDDAGPCRAYAAGAENVSPRGGWVAELNPNTGVILQDNSIDNSARVLTLITDLDGNLLAGATDELNNDWRLFNLDPNLMTNWQTSHTAGDVLRSLAVDRENFIYAGGGTLVAPINGLIVVFGDGGVVLDELVIDNGQQEGINGVAIDPSNRLVSNGQRSGSGGVTFLIYRVLTGKNY